LGADAVIVDLEDAAALSRKREARETAAAALADLDFGRSERLVRVNPAASGLQEDDLRALAAAPRRPDGLVLPKVESADEVRRVAAALPGAALLAIVE